MRTRPGISISDAVAAGATLLVVLLIETLRLNSVYVVAPFLALYATTVIAAAARGLVAGAMSGSISATYTIYAAVAGFGPETLTGGPIQVVIGLLIIGTVVVSIGRMKDRSVELIESLAAARDQLDERTRSLEIEVAERTADYVQMTARVFQIQEKERANLSRELHDEFGQLLMALKLALARLRSAPGADAALRDADEILDRLVHQTHSLSLLLHPVLLDGPGITGAIRRFVEQQAISAGWEFELDVDELPTELPKGTLLLCFRCVQEALTNIVKHADARRVAVSLRIEGDGIRITIEDDGRGFVVPSRWRVSDQGGLGLPGMVERFRAAGGELSISSGPGAGTRLDATVPVVAGDDKAEQRAAG